MNSFAINLITVFAEILLAWYFFSNTLHSGHVSKKAEAIYYLVYGLLLVLGFLCLSIIPLKLLILITWSLLGNHFVYRPKWLEAVYITALFYCSSIIADVIAGGVFSLLGYQIQLSLSGSELLIYNSIAKLFHLLLLYGILIFFARREQNDIPLRYQAVPLILCQAASTYTCYQLFFSLIDGQNSTADTIGALCLLYVNIVICVYAQKLKQTYYLRSQAQLAQEKLQAQQAYYQDAIQRQEETRALWHDIKKHLLVMESLAHSGEHTKLHTAYEEIRGKYTYLESAVDVGHPVVNAILAYAVRQAHSAEIDLTMDVWVSPALELSPADLYVIIGNTVDNAVEACKSLPKEARKLHLTLRQTNHILFYEITNPYSPNADDKPGPIHGYGLKNVEKCVKDHRGEMQITRESGQFTVSARLTV